MRPNTILTFLSKDRQAGQERTAESGDADPAAVEALWRKLPAELRRRIAVGIQADKSRDCIAIIRALATDYEATADEIVAIFRAHPDMVRGAWVRGRRLEGPAAG